MDIMKFWRLNRKAVGMMAVAGLLIALKQEWVTAATGEWLWPIIIGLTGYKMIDKK